MRYNVWVKHPSFFFFFFFGDDNWRQAEVWKLPGRLRLTLLPRERYGESLIDREWNTRPSNREADTLQLNYALVVSGRNSARITSHGKQTTFKAIMKRLMFVTI